MASAFPPQSISNSIIDAGDAPVFFIDGVAIHSVSAGVVRISLYAEQPVLEPGVIPGGTYRHMRVVVVKLVYTTDTQTKMRRQLVHHLGDSVRAADFVSDGH